jgi:hypothetical protein
VQLRGRRRATENQAKLMESLHHREKEAVKVSYSTYPFFFFFYSYVHTRLGSFLPPAPTPSLTTHSAPSLSPPSIPSRNYFGLISNFVVERV